MSGKLYVVGTPIGNLSDFSERGREALEKADFIAAEDTRVTVKLLNHFGIKKEMVSYYEHNKRDKGEFIINRILKGESCAPAKKDGAPGENGGADKGSEAAAGADGSDAGGSDENGGNASGDGEEKK